jgi:autotransporter-associated beta strand protein
MNAPRRSSSVRCGLLAMGIAGLLAAVVGRSPVATAADLVWVGNDAFNNSNFSDSGNWQGNTLPSWGFTNSLKFNQNQNSNVTGLNYNWGDWRAANDIFWDTTFPVARTLSASGSGGIDFKTRIENNSSFTQTVVMNLSGGKDGASDIQLNPVTGSLILSGTIYNDNSVDYAVFGSQTATVTNLVLNTALGPNATQTNVDFVVAGGRNTAVQVNASQVWAGTTSVQSGSFTTGTGVSLASSAIVVAGGTVTTTSANTFADTASLTVNTGRLAIGGSDTVASLSSTSGTVELASNATLTFGDSGSTAAFAITGAGNLTKVGSGTFTMTGPSSLTGTMTVEAGRVVLNQPMTASAVNVNGGSLAVNQANVLADTAAVTITGGTLSFVSVDTIGSLAGTGGTVVLATQPQAFVVNQNVNTTYAGTVNAGRFFKSGTGRLTLSGTVNANVEVSAGEIVVDGLCRNVDVSSATGTLAGTGTVTELALIAGVHAPGPGDGGPGIQTFTESLNPVVLGYITGASVNWDLIANTAAGAGTNYDQIAVPTGDLGFYAGSGAFVTLNLSFNGVGSSVDWSNAFWDVNRAWRVWDVGAGSTTGVEKLSVGGSLLDSLGNTLSPTTRGSFSISQDGQDVMLNFVAVPEPSTVGIVLSGLVFAAGYRCRKRRATGGR